MSSNERYVRMLVRQRQVQLLEEEKRALSAIPANVPWRDVPPAVQNIVRRLKAAERDATRLKAALERRGFQTYGVVVGRALNERSGPRDRKIGDIKRRFAARVTKLASYQNDGLIEVLGRTPKEAQLVLRKFAAAIRAV